MIAFFGIATLLGIAALLSSDRKAINLRTVGIAFLLQITIAALIIYVPYGRDALQTVVNGVQHVINYGNDGIEFVFGTQAKQSLGFTIALNVLPVIVFFSALMSVLYYLGIMQRVVGVLGGGLRKLLGTSETESMSAVSNVFVGHTEAPLVVKPYLATISNSELFAIMTGGCATIAGAVMAAYASMGVDLKYLISASFMAAPGGLLMAKIMMPETSAKAGSFDAEMAAEDQAVNIFEAIGNGAATGLTLALNVGAMLLAFVAMIALLNGMLGGIGGWFGYEDLTLQFLLGKLFAPIAYLIGVPWEEATVAGSLIGQKLVINEFYAYANFVQLKDALTEQTQVIVTFALCGFANLASIAILLGGLGSIVPSRRSDIARLGLRAVIGGTLANLMSATLAGIFVSL
ncbi:MAG: NupC/NupG family nucleoside CNT transporter [Woeseia sp.]|nr:NupC/NupG family nucleoside CNT transporter [Woeseia sp.]MBT8096654.1 NupC/NupG family nucleoside CNT transporter [Woeseia sp.]NNE61207.1 NupC/NupG family nucleoside CNT transporter [Woeseia sp.]